MTTMDIKKETLASSLTAQLREAILSGELAPDTPLRLQELADRFKVSLSPLRESLSRLSTERLVVMEDQRGARVAPVSAADCLEIVKLRCEFEAVALRESIANADDEWEALLVAAYHRLNKQESQGWLGPKESADWERLHRAYHQALMSACRMPTLLQMCGQFSDMYDRYRRLFLRRQKADATVHDEHEKIFRAAVARDSDQAILLLRRHIERTGSNVVAFVEQATKAGT